MIRRIFILLGLVFSFIFMGCGVIRNAGVKEAALIAVKNWAISNRIPYKVLKTKILSNDGGYAQIAVFAVTQDDKDQAMDSPREAVVEVRNLGGDWIAQPVELFESPFKSTFGVWVFESQECDFAMWEANNLSNTDCSVCVRIQNKGHFDWSWDGYTKVDCRHNGLCSKDMSSYNNLTLKANKETVKFGSDCAQYVNGGWLEWRTGQITIKSTPYR